MPMTQVELDAALDRTWNISVEVSPLAPIPDAPVYDPVRQIVENGFPITLRELLHAIGIKTANLPANQQDAAINASLKYLHLLDLDGGDLSFLPFEDTDLITTQSQETGIGIMCLLARRLYHIPWDQIEPLPAPGLRFDYRGRQNGFSGIFESKGTRNRSTQNSQIRHGLRKKQAHHNRGDVFDVELIISTHIGWQNTAPRILVGDPSFDRLAEIYRETDDSFFRLRHYARVLQFIGLPRTSYFLNETAKEELPRRKAPPVEQLPPVVIRQIIEEKQEIGYLEPLFYGGQRYVGRWFSTILPPESRRYAKTKFRLADKTPYTEPLGTRIFQGLRDDVYQSLIRLAPVSDIARDQVIELDGMKASIFADGTIQIFKQD